MEMVKFQDIQKPIAQELEALNELMRSWLASDNALMEHIVNNFLTRKGKQIRPMLVLLTGKFFGKVSVEVLRAGAAIELLHNASLIHDDVIDESKERRGQPTVNRVWDNHVAVLVGDFFVSSALSCAVSVGNMDVINVMARLSRELSLGEVSQFNNARNHLISEANYYDIIRHKTASLFRSCVEVGGLAAGADAEEIARLGRYVELMGVCFQIKDDIFDYYDDPIIGKPTANDLREGKMTLPLIYALSQKDDAEYEQMNALAMKSDLSAEEIQVLYDYAKRKGGIEYAKEAMKKLRTEANALLEGYERTEALQAFCNMFDYIIEREK